MLYPFLSVTDVTLHTRLPGHLKVPLQHKVHPSSILIIAFWSLFSQHHSFSEEGAVFYTDRSMNLALIIAVVLVMAVCYLTLLNPS